MTVDVSSIKNAFNSILRKSVFRLIAKGRNTYVCIYHDFPNHKAINLYILLYLAVLCGVQMTYVSCIFFYYVFLLFTIIFTQFKTMCYLWTIKFDYYYY